MKSWVRMKHFRAIGAYLALAVLMIGVLPGDLLAGFVPSAAMDPSTEAARPADLETIRQTLETRVVSDRLEMLGFSSEEVAARLDQLDDETLHETALRIDELQKGGDALGVVIALLVIALLVVLILKLSGKTIVIE